MLLHLDPHVLALIVREFGLDAATICRLLSSAQLWHTIEGTGGWISHYSTERSTFCGHGGFRKLSNIGAVTLPSHADRGSSLSARRDDRCRRIRGRCGSVAADIYPAGVQRQWLCEQFCCGDVACAHRALERTRHVLYANERMVISEAKFRTVLNIDFGTGRTADCLC